jgi:hypothetical protein
MLHRTRKRYAHNSTASRTYYEVLAITAGLVGRLAASMFTGNIYNESTYWLIGLAVALYNGAYTSDGLVEGTPEPEPDQSIHRIRTAVTQWQVRHQIRKVKRRFQ